MLSNLLKIVAAIFEWLLSESAVAKRKEESREDESEDIREDVLSGNVDAITARVDRLLAKRRSIKRSKSSED